MKTQTEELGYQKIADTLNILLELASDIKAALADGLQVTDALVIWQNFPELQKVYREGKEAIREFIDLTPDEAEEVIRQISNNQDIPQDKVFDAIKAAFRLLGRTYRIIDNLINEGKDLVEDWIEFFKTFKPAAA